MKSFVQGLELEIGFKPLSAAFKAGASPGLCRGPPTPLEGLEGTSGQEPGQGQPKMEVG